MTFHNENKRFATVQDFGNYLGTLPGSDWSFGATFHNTYIPNISQWRGHYSMLSMQQTYEQKDPPWDRGPHCYVAKGAPNPDNDGIWVMTPPNIPGIHAGSCNGTEESHSGRWGVELVGDFQNFAPTVSQLNLLADTIAELHIWRNIRQVSVNAHRDCMPGRTCPGNAFYAIKQTVIDMVNDRLTITPEETWYLWGFMYPLPTEQRSFGIPQTWYGNMTSTGSKLGPAMSFPVYSNNNVIQLFKNGMIINRSGQNRIIFYSEFRVP